MDKGLKAFNNLLNDKLVKPDKYHKTIRDIASAGQVIIVEKELKQKIELNKIQDELGIDLVTLFKALRNGFWVKEQNKNNELVHVRARLNVEEQTLDFFEPNMSTVGIGRNIFQYGKTWSLDKKDLMKEELL